MQRLAENRVYTEMFCLNGCEQQIKDLLTQKPELRGNLIVIDTRTDFELALDLNHAGQVVVIEGKNRKLVSEALDQLVFTDESVVYFNPMEKYLRPNAVNIPLADNSVSIIKPARTMGFIMDGLNAIKKSPLKIELQAILKNGTVVNLVLSPAGDVAYRDGNSVKILPADAFLTVESEIIVEKLLADLRAGLMTEEELIRMRSAEARYQLEAILGGAADKGLNEARSQIEKAGENIIAVAETCFKVETATLPRGNHNLQARIFYKAALESIEAERRIIAESRKAVLRIESIGNILNENRIRNGFEHRIISNGNLDFKEIESGQTFIKYRVGRNYSVVIK